MTDYICQFDSVAIGQGQLVFRTGVVDYNQSICTQVGSMLAQRPLEEGYEDAA